MVGIALITQIEKFLFSSPKSENPESSMNISISEQAERLRVLLTTSEDPDSKLLSSKQATELIKIVREKYTLSLPTDLEELNLKEQEPKESKDLKGSKESKEVEVRKSKKTAAAKISTEQQVKLANWLSKIIEKEKKTELKKPEEQKKSETISIVSTLEDNVKRLVKAAEAHDYLEVKELLNLPHNGNYKRYIWDTLIPNVIKDFQKKRANQELSEIEIRVLNGQFQKTILIFLEYVLDIESLYEDQDQNVLLLIKENLKKIGGPSRLEIIKNIFETYYQYTIRPLHFNNHSIQDKHWEEHWDKHSQCHTELLYAAAQVKPEKNSVSAFDYLVQSIIAEQKKDENKDDSKEDSKEEHSHKEYQVVDSILLPIMGAIAFKDLDSKLKSESTDSIVDQYLAIVSDKSKDGLAARAHYPELQSLKTLRESLYHYLKSSVIVTKVADLKDTTVKNHIGHYIIHDYKIYFVDPDDGNKKEIVFAGAIHQDIFYKKLFAVSPGNSKHRGSINAKEVIDGISSVNLSKEKFYSCATYDRNASNQGPIDRRILSSSLVAHNSPHTPRTLKEDGEIARTIIATIGAWHDAVQTPTEDAWKEVDNFVAEIPTIGARNTTKVTLVMALSVVLLLGIAAAVTFGFAAIAYGAIGLAALTATYATIGTAVTAGLSVALPGVPLGILYQYKQSGGYFANWCSTPCVQGMFKLFDKSRGKEKIPVTVKNRQDNKIMKQLSKGS